MKTATFLLQLILATIPDHVNSTSPRIVSDDNIKFLFEIQKKVCVTSCSTTEIF